MKGPETAGEGIRTLDVQLGNYRDRSGYLVHNPSVFSTLTKANEFRKTSHDAAFFRVLSWYLGVKVVVGGSADTLAAIG